MRVLPLPGALLSSETTQVAIRPTASSCGPLESCEFHIESDGPQVTKQIDGWVPAVLLVHRTLERSTGHSDCQPTSPTQKDRCAFGLGPPTVQKWRETGATAPIS